MWHNRDIGCPRCISGRGRRGGRCRGHFERSLESASLGASIVKNTTSTSSFGGAAAATTAAGSLAKGCEVRAMAAELHLFAVSDSAPNNFKLIS